MRHIECKLEFYLDKCVDFYKRYPLISIFMGSFLIIILSSLVGWDAIAAIGTISAVIISLHFSLKKRKAANLNIVGLEGEIRHYSFMNENLNIPLRMVGEDTNEVETVKENPNRNFIEYGVKITFMVQNTGENPLVIRKSIFNVSKSLNLNGELSDLNGVILNEGEAKYFSIVVDFHKDASESEFIKSVSEDNSLMEDSSLSFYLVDGQERQANFEKIKSLYLLMWGDYSPKFYSRTPISTKNWKVKKISLNSVE